MLLEFYGTECPYCKKMAPLVEKLMKEEKLKVEQYETWHDEENDKKREEYDKDFCGGVPFFYNAGTNQWLCGSVSYDELKEWALGKN